MAEAVYGTEYFDFGVHGLIGTQTVAVADIWDCGAGAGGPLRPFVCWRNRRGWLRPDFVAVYDPGQAAQLKTALADTPIRVAGGAEALTEAAVIPGADCVVTAVSGAVGLAPTLAAILAGRRIALANKETLVCAGAIVMGLAAETGAEILPVDSEHSAIFQALQDKRGELQGGFC